jgi:uncharacterized protein (TIGR00255 family)
MTLSSMTGFARQEGEWRNDQWAWELRSVNARNLDVRVRVPNQFDGLEQQVRKIVSAQFKRGSIQVNLQLSRSDTSAEIAINRKALGDILSAMEDLKLEVDASPPTLDGLMSLKGVIETREPEESDEDRLEQNGKLIQSLEEAVAALRSARDQEGFSLAEILSSQITEVESLTQQAAAMAAKLPKTLQTRLQKQLDELLEGRSSMPDERLAQEVAFLATKADVREEIDRLKAHCAAARELLNADEPVGRKLDFLTQEFNRESNTLCSKAADIELTRIGLELKTIVDQIREQVQNIE